MRRSVLLPIASLAAVGLLVVPPANASLHPDAFADGANALGNTVYCVTSGPTGSTFCLNNVDAVDVGFNDPAPAAPIGGNTGETVGEQRINAYMESFRVWGDTLTTGETVWVQATFGPLACTATGGTLGAAGTIQIWANFGGDSWPTTWYHSALANRLAGTDLAPGSPDPELLGGDFADDIVSFFNGDLGTPGCLEGLSWYYGYDANQGATQIDFLQVLTHEVGHGLGHANFIDEDGSPSGCASTGSCAAPPGSGPNGWPDIYTAFSRDWNSGKHWNQMNDAERAASTVADELVWDGPNTHTAAASYLDDASGVVENSPDSELFRAQESSYTPPPTPAGVTGNVVLYNDLSGADPNDACDLVCDPAVVGNIALINRGTCNFSLKSAIAELCGATGVVIANNAPTGLPGMGGTPLIVHATTSVGISKSAGNAIKADLAGGPVNVTILKDGTITGQAGADRGGFPRLYAPSPVAPGSSVSHWDTTLTPNTLMEPFISADLDVVATLDLSPAQMTDVGWDGAIHCPVGSDDGATIVIGGCDTGVANELGPWTLIGGPAGKGIKTTSGTINSGCYMADMIHGCAAGAQNHGDFSACADSVANGLRKQGAISAADSDAIKACADGAAIP